MIFIDHEARLTASMTLVHWLRHPARALALALCWPAHLFAQTEAGVARDAKTGAPLECLHVALVDSANRAVAHTVTDASGQFSIEAPHPGPYRVRFEIFGWEPLAGPLDTLVDGDFKQRRYPLDFTGLIWPKDLPRRTILDTAESVRAEHKRQEREAFTNLGRGLRSREDSTAWRSRQLTGELRVRYPPDLWARGLQGSVVGQVIIDAQGKPRVETWQTIRLAHKDFEKAVLSVLGDMRWNPALLAGRPSCELVRGVVEFSLDFSTPAVEWAHIRYTF